MKIFYLPDLGEGLAEAEIREWYVKVGDTVKLDQPLVSVETAKAVVDVPSPCAGRIEKLHGKVHDLIKTEAPLVEFEEGEGEGSIVGKLEKSHQPLQEEEVIIGSTNTTPMFKAPPIVKALAQRLNVDLSTVMPSGPQGQITAEDVKRHAQDKPQDMQKGESLHGVRRAMAKIMTEAHAQVAQITLMDDVDLGHISVDADITVLVLQAMAAAAKAEPALNAWFDSKNMQRQLLSDINIGLAIDTDEGLFVPVLKKVNECSPAELREKINSFKASVTSRTISPSDMLAATITLSNFGTIAGKYASPIVVPPMVAIVGCGRIYEGVVAREGKAVVSRILPLSLSADHRAVTGGEAARFLAMLKKFLHES